MTRVCVWLHIESVCGFLPGLCIYTAVGVYPVKSALLCTQTLHSGHACGYTERSSVLSCLALIMAKLLQHQPSMPSITNTHTHTHYQIVNCCNLIYPKIRNIFWRLIHASMTLFFTVRIKIYNINVNKIKVWGYDDGLQNRHSQLV